MQIPIFLLESVLQLAHCTPIHHEPGISLWHVAAWTLIVLAIAGMATLLIARPMRNRNTERDSQ